MNPIAHIETPFKTKFGVPRQAGLADYNALVVFEPDYRIPEAVRGIEEFDYLWLIWQFHLNNKETNNSSLITNHSSLNSSLITHHSSLNTSLITHHSSLNSSLNTSLTTHHSSFKPTVRPPRLGGNKRVGVFATRSPFRPNPIGLSCVRLLRVEPGPVLVVQGADLVDGTPILDIKPYLPYADSHPDARSGFATAAPPQALSVDDPQGLLATIPADLRAALVESLAQDPRPHYQDDPDRLYAMLFDRFEIKFRVTATTATLTSIKQITHNS